MNRGAFEAQLNTAWDVLRELELAEYRVWHPEYGSSIVSKLRGQSYLDVWKICFREQLFNFQLADNSLVQFRIESFTTPEFSYAYYECPYQTFSYSEFLVNNGYDPDEVGDELRDEYEVYLTTSPLKETVTPIRYDYKPAHYREGIHPAAHVHFGYLGNVRVGTQKVLLPLSFVLLILRQCYPNAWQRLVSLPDAEIWCRNVRDNLVDIDGRFRNRLDGAEMILL